MTDFYFAQTAHKQKTILEPRFNSARHFILSASAYPNLSASMPLFIILISFLLSPYIQIAACLEQAHKQEAAFKYFSDNNNVAWESENLSIHPVFQKRQCENELQ